MHGLQRRYIERFSRESGVAWGAQSRRLAWLQAGAVLYIFVVEAAALLVFLPLSFTLAERFTDRAGAPRPPAREVPAFGAASLIHLYWHYHMKRVLLLSAVLAFLVLWLN